MTTIPQLPTAASVGPTDLLALSQNSMLYAASVQQVTAGLQHEISLPTGDLLGRNSAGAGAPEAVTPGAGLALGAGTLAATGTDHLGFALLGAFSATDEVVVNAQGAPGRLPVTALRGLFAAGTGLAIDANGTLSVTASAIAGATGPAGPAGAAGPAGPAGPAGSGLNAPGATNSASTIGSADFVAIWQNGANAWLSYEKLVGGQTIDQLPAAGPAADSDLLLVAQGGNALASQSFAAIWTYAAQKIPTMRRQVVELNSNTVLDATTHNQRVLVASQPITLTANFTNMGSGFTCRVINLAAGPVTMGTGITSGTGVATLPPGTAAELTALTYSGGSLVWWDGIALPTPTITVNAPGSPAANAPFTVSGGLFDEAPTALDYSTDGTNWTAVASPMIGAGSYSFQVPGLPAGSYTIAVRDHNAPGVVGRSAPFSVATAAIALAAVPASASAGGTIAVSGTVAPAGTAVQVGLSASA
ncbi:MAG TPA: collagen-like protein, partial [Acidiphilium sp.]|nr:collagen-like protein [Acidiphilium sp.]